MSSTDWVLDLLNPFTFLFPCTPHSASRLMFLWICWEKCRLWLSMCKDTEAWVFTTRKPGRIWKQVLDAESKGESRKEEGYSGAVIMKCSRLGVLYLSLSLSFFFFFALTRHLFVLPPTSSCLSNNCPLTLCVSAQGSLFWSPVYHPITLPCHSVPLFLALISVWSYFDYLLVFCLLTYLLVSSKMQVQESRNFAQDAYSYNT